jgi:NADH:ubiquinone oxidoreductase subunit E
MVEQTTTDNWAQVERLSRAALPESIVKFIETCRQGPHPESQLISILHKVQGHFGYLGEEQMNAVAQLLQVPTTKVTGVATFYHYFRLKPRGKFLINVCLGTACYVKGSEAIMMRFREELGIELGETTRDGMFTLQASRCLGTCGLAPVVMINDEVHGKVRPDQVIGLIEACRQKAKETITE